MRFLFCFLSDELALTVSPCGNDDGDGDGDVRLFRMLDTCKMYPLVCKSNKNIPIIFIKKLL